MDTPTPQTAGPLLEVEDLTVDFELEGVAARAVSGVSFTIAPGEVLGVVGESGCGKSVTALSLMRLLPTPPASVSATVLRFAGLDLMALPEREMRAVRGARMAMIFQDPLSALNPVLTVGYQVAEALALHRRVSIKAAWEPAVEMLGRVGLPDAESRARAYPHEISGGQQQRVMIAMAFICGPELVIADEPTTALDVTIQAQILDLMASLKKKLNTAIMLITHDLGVIAQVCDRVLVMYAGRVIEDASVHDIFYRPQHPYTQALLESIPRSGGKERGKRLPTIEGMVPSLHELPSGCRFSERCRYCEDRCVQEEPDLLTAEDGRRVRCHFPLSADRTAAARGET
ncbi:MAG: ABC transporter ATP-binding protein [Planctomycetes bacterium]|nr:ABC transporter ATP-binding protein [Planctomycetota bacterium]